MFPRSLLLIKLTLQGKGDGTLETSWGANQFINQNTFKQVQQTSGDTVQIQDFGKTLATLYVGQGYLVFKDYCMLHSLDMLGYSYLPESTKCCPCHHLFWWTLQTACSWQPLFASDNLKMSSRMSILPLLRLGSHNFAHPPRFSPHLGTLQLRVACRPNCYEEMNKIPNSECLSNKEAKHILAFLR